MTPQELAADVYYAYFRIYPQDHEALFEKQPKAIQDIFIEKAKEALNLTKAEKDAYFLMGQMIAPKHASDIILLKHSLLMKDERLKQSEKMIDILKQYVDFNKMSPAVLKALNLRKTQIS